jgi:hypothetical protein
MIAQVATIYYFAHFLIILPLVSKFEKPCRCPIPSRKACSMASRRNRLRSGFAPAAGNWAVLRSHRLNKVYRTDGPPHLHPGRSRLRHRRELVAGQRHLCRTHRSAGSASRARVSPRAQGRVLHHEGPFGKYDRQQLQRGFQVYKESVRPATA